MYLKVDDVADLLGVSPAKVRTWINEGSLPAMNVNNGTRPRWVILSGDVDEFLRSRRTQPKQVVSRQRKPSMGSFNRYRAQIP